MTRQALTAFGTILVAQLACGWEVTWPMVEFPPLPANFVEATCVRGNLTQGQGASSQISSADCFFGSEYGPAELWRVRVVTAGPVTFDVQGAFNSVLQVYNPGPGDTTAFSNFVDENDDRGQCTGGTEPNCNPLLAVALAPGEDYFVVVFAHRGGEGTYTLSVR